MVCNNIPRVNNTPEPIFKMVRIRDIIFEIIALDEGNIPMEWNSGFFE
jgi:hypothetical protein